MADGPQFSTSRTLRTIASEIDPAVLARKDSLKYAVVPIEWLRAVQPIDPRERPRTQTIPADMVAALEELLAAAKSDKALSLDQELALRAAAWSAPSVF